MVNTYKVSRPPFASPAVPRGAPAAPPGSDRCTECLHGTHEGELLGCLAGRVWQALDFADAILDVAGYFRGGCFCQHVAPLVLVK